MVRSSGRKRKRGGGGGDLQGTGSSNSNPRPETPPPPREETEPALAPLRSPHVYRSVTEVLRAKANQEIVPFTLSRIEPKTVVQSSAHHHHLAVADLTQLKILADNNHQQSRMEMETTTTTTERVVAGAPAPPAPSTECIKVLIRPDPLLPEKFESTAKTRAHIVELYTTATKTDFDNDHQPVCSDADADSKQDLLTDSDSDGDAEEGVTDPVAAAVVPTIQIKRQPNSNSHVIEINGKRDFTLSGRKFVPRKPKRPKLEEPKKPEFCQVPGQEHISIINGGKLFLCTKCRKMFKSRSNCGYHEVCADKSKILKCPQCEHTVRSRSHLDYHVKSAHSGEKPFICDECSQSFIQKSKLERHVRNVHRGLRPFPCPTCGKGSASLQQLENHVRTHTGEKPFGCRICPTRFNTPGGLKRHMVLHSGERPFECQICRKCFAAKNTLDAHQRTHTGERDFPCPEPECGQAFGTQKDAQRHHNSKHSGFQLFICKFCNNAYNRKDNFNRHLKNVHKVKQELIAAGDLYEMGSKLGELITDPEEIEKYLSSCRRRRQSPKPKSTSPPPTPTPADAADECPESEVIITDLPSAVPSPGCCSDDDGNGDGGGGGEAMEEFTYSSALADNSYVGVGVVDGEDERFRETFASSHEFDESESEENQLGISDDEFEDDVRVREGTTEAAAPAIIVDGSEFSDINGNGAVSEVGTDTANELGGEFSNDKNDNSFVLPFPEVNEPLTRTSSSAVAAEGSEMLQENSANLATFDKIDIVENTDTDKDDPATATATTFIFTPFIPTLPTWPTSSAVAAAEDKLKGGEEEDEIFKIKPSTPASAEPVGNESTSTATTLPRLPPEQTTKANSNICLDQLFLYADGEEAEDEEEEDDDLGVLEDQDEPPTPEYVDIAESDTEEIETMVAVAGKEEKISEDQHVEEGDTCSTSSELPQSQSRAPICHESRPPPPAAPAESDEEVEELEEPFDSSASDVGLPESDSDDEGEEEEEEEEFDDDKPPVLDREDYAYTKRVWNDEEQPPQLERQDQIELVVGIKGTGEDSAGVGEEVVEDEDVKGANEEIEQGEGEDEEAESREDDEDVEEDNAETVVIGESEVSEDLELHVEEVVEGKQLDLEEIEPEGDDEEAEVEEEEELEARIETKEFEGEVQVEEVQVQGEELVVERMETIDDLDDEDIYEEYEEIIEEEDLAGTGTAAAGAGPVTVPDDDSDDSEVDYDDEIDPPSSPEPLPERTRRLTFSKEALVCYCLQSKKVTESLFEPETTDRVAPYTFKDPDPNSIDYEEYDDPDDNNQEEVEAGGDDKENANAADLPVETPQDDGNDNDDVADNAHHGDGEQEEEEAAEAEAEAEGDKENANVGVGLRIDTHDDANANANFVAEAVPVPDENANITPVAAQLNGVNGVGANNNTLNFMELKALKMEQDAQYMVETMSRIKQKRPEVGLEMEKKEQGYEQYMKGETEGIPGSASYFAGYFINRPKPTIPLHPRYYVQTRFLTDPECKGEFKLLIQE